jgi:hypothetical protein
MQACQIMIAALSEFHADHTRRQICSARIFHGPNSNAKELVTYVAMLETENAIFENLAVSIIEKLSIDLFENRASILSRDYYVIVVKGPCWNLTLERLASACACRSVVSVITTEWLLASYSDISFAIRSSVSIIGQVERRWKHE